MEFEISLKKLLKNFQGLDVENFGKDTFIFCICNFLYIVLLDVVVTMKFNLN